MMLRLKTLGGLALLATDGTPRVASTQRRRLALLALASAYRDAGIPRDRAMALLWPDVDDDRARHSLGQLVYALRRDGGVELLAPSGPILLSTAAVSVDRWRLEDAVARGALTEAVDAYDGAFLDGFHLPDAGEFDQWVEQERVTLAARHAERLERLACEASRQGDARGAAAWWARAAAHEPLDPRVALAYITALVDAGDLAAAERQARIHEMLLQQALDVRPDPAIARVLATARTRADERPRPAVETVAALPPEEYGPAAASSSFVASATAEALPPHVPATSAPAEVATRRASSRRMAFVAGAALIVVAVGVLVARGFPGRAPGDLSRGASNAPATQAIALLPFRAAADSTGRYLRDAVPVLLGATLDGVGRLRTVDGNAVYRAAQDVMGAGVLAADRAAIIGPDDGRAIARRVGASYFLLGEIAVAGDRIQVNASLYDTVGQAPVARSSASGALDSLFSIADRLASTLVADERWGVAGDRPGAEGRTTTSMAALRAFVAGEDEHRVGRFDDAARAYRGAIAADSGFALAWVRLAMVQGWINEDATPALQAALRWQGRLAPRDGAIMRIMLARREGRPDDAERAAREALLERPGDATLQLALGDLLFHENPGRGRSGAEAAAPLALALAADPRISTEALFHLIPLRAFEGDRLAVDTLTAALERSGVAPWFCLPAEIVQVVLHGDTVVADSLAQRLAVAPPSLTRLALEQAIMTEFLAPGAKAIVVRMATRLTAPTTSTPIQAQAWAVLAVRAAARGEWSVVRAALARAAQLGHPDIVRVRAALFALPFAEVPIAERRAARDAIRALARGMAAASDGLADLSFVRWQLDDALDDAADATDALSTLDASAQGPANWPRRSRARVLATAARVQRLAESGHADSARLLLATRGGEPSPVPVRYLRAELLRTAGRSEEALGWYAAATQDYGALVYTAPYLAQAARAASERGDREAAQRYAARLAALLEHAEGSLRALISR
jgi:DNA-binding SARP family transcriptional activator/TolB-like protein